MPTRLRLGSIRPAPGVWRSDDSVLMGDRLFIVWVQAATVTLVCLWAVGMVILSI